MIIGVNERYEIKQIDNITDSMLNQIELNRQEVFSDWSDIRILCCCYKSNENGYSVYPYINDSKIGEIESEILGLQAQVIELEFEKIGGTAI